MSCPNSDMKGGQPLFGNTDWCKKFGLDVISSIINTLERDELKEKINAFGEKVLQFMKDKVEGVMDDNEATKSFCEPAFKHLYIDTAIQLIEDIMEIYYGNEATVKLEDLHNMLRPYYLSEIIVNRHVDVMDGLLKEEYYMPFELKKKRIEYDDYEALYKRKRSYLTSELVGNYQGKDIVVENPPLPPQPPGPARNQAEQKRYKRARRNHLRSISYQTMMLHLLSSKRLFLYFFEPELNILAPLSFFEEGETTKHDFNTYSSRNNVVIDAQLSPVVEYMSSDTTDAWSYVMKCQEPLGTRAGTPVAVNFANNETPGGGAHNGALAQEESLCYRSNLLFKLMDAKLDKGMYPIVATTDNPACICSRAFFFRDSNYKFLSSAGKEVMHVSVFDIITLPAIDTRNTTLTYDKITEYNTQCIQLMLLIGHGHFRQRGIVLGGWGCGVFAKGFDADKFPGKSKEEYVQSIASTYAKLLTTEPYKYLYSHIVFAVLGGGPVSGKFEKMVKVLQYIVDRDDVHHDKTDAQKKQLTQDTQAELIETDFSSA